jgi:hypothetical protein
MSHVDDAKELGFEQLALRIVRDFNRFHANIFARF